MQNFTKRIPINQEFNPEFFFNRIYTVHGVRYHISVMDKQRAVYILHMEIEKGKWYLVNKAKLPEWILAVEDKLEKAIFDSMT
jgi:hypothetical protein